MKIYISHEPEDEPKARAVAEAIKVHGDEAIVAADVRPHKDYIHDDNDRKVVAKAIESCDFVMLLRCTK